MKGGYFMGLDMYAFFVKKENIISDEDFNLVYGQVENFYWRKNYRLHNWMEKLWEAKTGNTDCEDFDCAKIRLSMEDIDELEKAIKAWGIDDSKPFSFSKYTSNMKEHDLQFCHEAKEAIKDGYAVYYDSSW
jgi:hypothetical protein